MTTVPPPATNAAGLANTALASLTDRLLEADETSAVAAEVRPFFDPDHGALGKAASVLWAVGEHAQSLIVSMAESDPAYRLWHQLASAAEHLGDLQTELATTADALQALTASQGPGLREVARAQSPALTGRTVAASPAAPSAPAPSTATIPDRGRTR
ncbi:MULTISPECIES: hypothetical protein [Streptomyces]|uniref:Uncharacterized protein n=1 Tax=Streptomyces tsukubensis (strain DSM 42081 / NBRC 108919 / NRRL 18488 / 9993) TaxID=1114943 RepID=I2N6Q7_STRT9|nr:MULTISPECIES: hypothetical protein [Streptomyces]AZK96632.1 hypothetical protein B7R87_24270 [Streptomyces tsukubensis]EIF92704.1 hypothetical protein [Streptomyces tsukubensis NRRL18488]MYS67830.1 hypothetical protein [Streptomyces sp. SID5473]QKM67366.1 hypothetical protein STSU_009500 [Streptomyces tsukubensis NRRL18488]TAI42069.1 hypothetical protein EWI31_24360 [Streptomyces tsukubensis]